MSYSFPVMGRCRVTVTISVKELLLHRRSEANPLANRETMLGRSLALNETTLAHQIEQEPLRAPEVKVQYLGGANG